MTDIQTITRQLVADKQRMELTAELFGINFPMRLEPFIYIMADKLAEEYKGGYWEFYALINGGFYMAPNTDTSFHVCCENGFEGNLSADAFGIVCSLYAYSHLSFGEPGKFAETCAQQYHLLREYMFEHAEVRTILQAVD